MGQTRSQRREQLKTKGREGHEAEMTDCETSTVNSINSSSFQPPKEPFPWRRLPRELQVKILQNLLRCDLDRCQLVNREMFELIRHSGRSLKRRYIDNLEMDMGERGELTFVIECSEERIFKVWSRCLIGPSKSLTTLTNACLPLVLRNADIRRLEITQARLTRGRLASITSCLLQEGCRVQELWITESSLRVVSSTTLLLFFRNVDPAEIIISGIEFVDCFSPDVIQYIVTRRGAHMTYFGDHNIPIDDYVLTNLTAVEITIGFRNMITLEGLKSFVENLASGKQRIESGIIYTPFSLKSVSLPSIPKIYQRVVWGGNAIEFQAEIIGADGRSEPPWFQDYL